MGNYNWFDYQSNVIGRPPFFLIGPSVSKIAGKEVGLKLYSLFNLANYSMKILDIADQISQTTGAEIIKLPPSAAHKFTMRTDKFEKVNNFHFKHGL